MPDKFQSIRMIAMDVDGVLTDGSMTYASAGEIKSFNAKDGLGIRLARAAGIEIVWITGNESAVVAKRAADLKVSGIYQGSRLKTVALAEAANRWNVKKEEIAYIGDDLNDLPAFADAGLSIAVGDAVDEVIQAADLVTTRLGGRGAVREAIETILKAQGRWEQAINEFLNELSREQFDSEAAEAVN